MKWSRWVWLVFAIGVGAVIFISYYTVRPAKGIDIGVMFDLSGSGAAYDVSTVQGITLAINEINQSGGLLGQEIRQITVDNQGKNELAAEQLKDLGTKHVSAVIGPNITFTALAVAPLAEAMHIPLISPAGTHPDITVSSSRQVYSYVYRAAFIDSCQGRLMAEFAQNVLGARTSAVVYDAHEPYSQGLAEFYRKAFIVSGGTVPIFIGIEKREDILNALETIRQHPCDVVYAPFYEDHAAMCLKVRHDLGMTMPFLGADGWHGMQLARNLSPAYLEQVYYADHYSYGTTANAEKFADAYYQQYGEWPDSYAALGYDAVQILAEAVRRSNSTQAKDIADALGKTIQFDGVTGTISMDGNHDAIKPVYIIYFEEGKPAVFQTMQLQDR